MHLNSRQLQTSCLLLVLLLQSVQAKSLKITSRPVHEIINEQSRADIDKARYVNAAPGVLEYGNPLAGNSKLVAAQKARIHTQHQQAMFTAERNRQQRAQLQRFKAAPQPDSYMKAYHESHEKHHIDLEKQLANSQGPAHKTTHLDTKHFSLVKNQPRTKPVNAPELRYAAGNTENKQTVRRLKPKQLNNAFSSVDAIKLTKDDIVHNEEKNRNHRSQGSMYVLKADMPHYVTDRTHAIYVTATPSDGEHGVTIKPHSNIGLTTNGENVQPTPDPSQLFTESIASQTQVIYPRQYAQMQGYKSAVQLNALNSLLTKTPHDQLSGLNALLDTQPHANKESLSGNAALEHPIDLYFYSKDLPSDPKHITAQQYEPHYHNPYTYGSAYGHQTPLFHPNVVKDHTPITEQIDDIADPNKNLKLKTYGIKSILATEKPKEMTTKTANNYYKVEVASQTISGHTSPEIENYGLQSTNSEYVHEDDSDKYFQHTKGYVSHGNEETGEQQDESERYHHHNAKGIHPLSSEYENDDNLHYAANYEFGYRVRDHETGNDFGHQETKIGEKTNGQYHVLLPDGRLQNVKYWAGPDGYRAHVSYAHA